MATLVTERTGKETAAWAELSGTAAGTIIFSAFYQNIADFATATERSWPTSGTSTESLRPAST